MTVQGSSCTARLRGDNGVIRAGCTVYHNHAWDRCPRDIGGNVGSYTKMQDNEGFSHGHRRFSRYVYGLRPTELSVSVLSRWIAQGSSSKLAAVGRGYGLPMEECLMRSFTEERL